MLEMNFALVFANIIWVVQNISINAAEWNINECRIVASKAVHTYVICNELTVSLWEAYDWIFEVMF